MSILGTAIYLITNHISEVQYNNWGNGVWSGLLAIQSDGNCSGSSTDEKYYKACIKQDISTYYDLNENMWYSDYWKTYYDGKLNNNADKEKFQKLGSWEKFRALCTKGIDEMIRKNEWSKLSSAVGTSSQSTSIPSTNNDINYADCLKAKTVTK